MLNIANIYKLMPLVILLLFVLQATPLAFASSGGAAENVASLSPSAGPGESAESAAPPRPSAESGEAPDNAAAARASGRYSSPLYVTAVDMYNGDTLIPRTEVAPGSTLLDALKVALAAGGHDYDADLEEAFGYVSSLLGLGGGDTAWMFTLNGEIPTESLTETISKIGDELTLFHFDWNDTAYVTRFEERVVSGPAGEAFKFVLTGADTMSFFSEEGPQFGPISGATVIFYDINGAIAGESGPTDQNGMAAYTFDKAGAYTVSAVRPGAINATDLVPPPLITVKVDAPQAKNDTGFISKYCEILNACLNFWVSVSSIH